MGIGGSKHAWIGYCIGELKRSNSGEAFDSFVSDYLFAQILRLFPEESSMPASSLYSGTRVSGGSFPSHTSWTVGPDLWLTPSTHTSVGLRQSISRDPM